MNLKIALRPGEAPALALSFLYFLLLLAAYYLLRPVRDGLVAALGAEHVKILNLYVLVAMLLLAPVFGALMTRVPRTKLLPAIYLFAIANLLAFAFVFANPAWQATSTRVFFVWLMVFNMFVVSVFWSFMADIWNEEQGRRLFGAIAAGGSVGGLIGPKVAEHSISQFGNSGLTLLAAALLTCALLCLMTLSRRIGTSTLRESPAPSTGKPLEGSSLQSVVLVLRSPLLRGIAALVCISAVAAQFAYVETAKLVKSLYDSQVAMTAFYARIDFWTNTVTLVFQAIVVGLLTSRFGIRAPLLGIAIIGALSFIPVALSPVIGVLALTTVVRRATEYGLAKPGRDMLYTVTSPQEKYLAKNVIDTLIYRMSDSLGNLLHTVLVAMGMALAGLSWSAAALVGASSFIALAVAREYRRRGGK